MRRRDLHRGLVALDRDQALLGLDGVTRLDQQLDHRDRVEITDVGHEDLDRAGRSRSGCRHRRGRRSSRGRCRHRSRCGRCRSRRGGTGHLERQHHGAFVDLVAQGDLEVLDHAGVRAGDLHRGLVALDGEQALLGLDGVTRLDQQFDDRDVLEIPDVGDLHFNQCHVVVSGTAQAYSGLILSALMPYLAIASATTVVGTAPSSASARRAATTM